jgi:ferredoxin
MLVPLPLVRLLAAVLLLVPTATALLLPTRRTTTPQRRSRPSSWGAPRRTAVCPPQQPCWCAALSSTPSDDDDNTAKDDSPPTDDRIDVTADDRLYRIRLSRATGIEWGTDLSFSFVYVRAMDPTGAAAYTGEIALGDQICELAAVVHDDNSDAAPIPLAGAAFDVVMEAFADLDKSISDVDLVFFRGTKEELKAAAKGEALSSEPEVITVTVIENKGSETEMVRTLQAPVGVNLRQLCVDNEINVYQSFTRWTNCKGKQLCGTCIVNIPQGSTDTNRKSMDEASTLRENPESYRLSCVTFAYGDVTIETFPPIKASQWTR